MKRKKITDEELRNIFREHNAMTILYQNESGNFMAKTIYKFDMDGLTEGHAEELTNEIENQFAKMIRQSFDSVAENSIFIEYMFVKIQLFQNKTCLQISHDIEKSMRIALTEPTEDTKKKLFAEEVFKKFYEE